MREAVTAARLGMLAGDEQRVGKGEAGEDTHDIVDEQHAGRAGAVVSDLHVTIVLKEGRPTLQACRAGY